MTVLPVKSSFQSPSTHIPRGIRPACLPTRDIVFYDIEGMGHVWPMNEAIGPGATSVAEYEEVDYLDEAIAFFDSHPLS